MSQFSKKIEEAPITQTIQDYLMTMHVLERDHSEIVAARLAEQLGVTAPTVTMTLKRMERDHWITGKSRHGGIHLTDAGRQAAHAVVRRHMLTEWLLLKILKVPFLQIHAEAHHMEHAISDMIEERLMNVLGSPQTCPHGNPLPGFESVTNVWPAVIDFSPGDKVVIRRIHEFAEDNRDLLKFLFENKVMPGSKATLMEALPFNQTVTLSVNSQAVVLGFAAARSIYGEKI